MREAAMRKESELKDDLLDKRVLSSFGFILTVQIFAFWAAWRWLALRVWTSTEERWNLVAMAAAVFFTFFFHKFDSIDGRTDASRSQFPRFGSAASIFFTFLYAASFAFASPFPRAILAVTALTCTLSIWRFGKTFDVGLWSLLLLSLPSIASLQFFLGYPLRVAVGQATAFLLRMQGLDVWREGVCLHFGEKLIWIDAPCSGIKMLWFGLFLAAFLVCFYRLSNLKSLLVLASAFVIILLGNVFRASALFYIEAEIIEAPAFMHQGTGVFAFVFIAAGIVCAARFWKNLGSGGPNGFFPDPRAPKPENRTGKRIFSVLFLTACLAAFSAAFWFAGEKTIKSSVPNSDVFPAVFEGFNLRELPLSERESYFLEDFPGNIGRFSDGRREIIIRYVREATRKLHPANDCFRAVGYAIKPLPLKIDDEGKRWSCFSAAKADEKLRVCERIYNAAGNEWTDVSSWYWAALNDPQGEWWAITVADRSAD